MRIVCRGNTTAIHTHYELAVVNADPFRMTLARPTYWTPVAGGPEELQPVFARADLAMSPSGMRAGVSFERRGWSILEVLTRVASRSTAVALTFLTDDLLLSLRPIDDAQHTLALHRGRHGSVPERVATPEAVAVDWPRGDGRLWDSVAPTALGTLSADASMVSNEHGHTIADSEAGLIIRVGVAEGVPTAHRVPSEGPHSQVNLAAYATPHGFLAAYSGGRGAGVVNHFSVEGRHLGAIAVSGNVSDICIAGFTVMFMREKQDFSGDLEIVVASLPELTITEVVPTTVSTYHGYPGLDARDFGREVWAGNGARVQNLLRTARGWETRAVDLDQLPLVTPTTVSPQVSAPAIAEDVGREVVHSKFGAGRVVAQDGTGDQAKLRIEFADGVRTVLARFVRDR